MLLFLAGRKCCLSSPSRSDKCTGFAMKWKRQFYVFISLFVSCCFTDLSSPSVNLPYSLLFRGSAVAAAQDIRAVFHPLHQAGLLTEAGLCSFLRCSFCFLPKRRALGIQRSGLAAWIWPGCSHTAKPVDLNVLLYKHIIHTGFVHLDCCGGAASGVPSTCEYYQGGAWHQPLFREVGLPHIYRLLCASLWQAVWCKNSHLSDLWFVLLQIASNRPPSPPVVLFPGCMIKPLGFEWDSNSAPVISREGGRGRSLTPPLGCLKAHSFCVLPPPAVIGSRGRVSDFSIPVSKINASCWATCFLALLRHSCLIIVFLAFGYE